MVGYVQMVPATSCQGRQAGEIYTHKHLHNVSRADIFVSELLAGARKETQLIILSELKLVTAWAKPCDCVIQTSFSYNVVGGPSDSRPWVARPHNRAK